VTASAPFLCPRCGGGLGVREGSRIGRCAHCGTSFLARFPGDEPRYLLPPAQDERALGARVRALLRSGELPRDLPRRASLLSSDLLLVPYWRIQATVVGRLRGTREVRRAVHEPDLEADAARFPLYGGKSRVVRIEEVDKPIREIWGATLSACPADDLGIPTLSPLRQRSAGMLVTRKLGSLPGLRFFDRTAFDQGKVLDVMVPRRAAEEGAEALFRRFIETRGFDVDGRRIRYLRLQRRCYLLYYPVQVVRFRYRQRLYRVVLDAHQGSVIHAQLPIASTQTLALVMSLLFGGAALTALPLRLVLSPPPGMAELAGLAAEPRFWGAMALLGAGMLAVARQAFDRLRLPVEKVVRG